MTTEAERQAARYEEDPDGALQWFIDHPEEAREWERAFLERADCANQMSFLKVALIVLMIVVSAIVWITLPQVLRMFRP